MQKGFSMSHLKHSKKYDCFRSCTRQFMTHLFSSREEGPEVCGGLLVKLPVLSEDSPQEQHHHAADGKGARRGALCHHHPNIQAAHAMRGVQQMPPRWLLQFDR